MYARIRKISIPSVDVTSTYTRIKYGRHLLQFHVKYEIYFIYEKVTPVKSGRVDGQKHSKETVTYTYYNVHYSSY